MNYTKYFAYLRRNMGLSQSVVDGTKRITEHGRLSGTQVNRLAYILATAYWETGRTMQPVVEAFWKDEAWRKANLRYYPWHGRGLIQTTWKRNYEAIAVAMGLRKTFFTEDPSRLLQWKYSIPALFTGMEKGIYTGHKLSHHIDLIDETDDKDYAEYVAARRIVNGVDKQSEIAKLALVYEKALKYAGYKAGPSGGLNIFDIIANFFASLFGWSGGTSTSSSRPSNNDWR